MTRGVVGDRVRGLSGTLLSDNWGKLWRYSYEFLRSDATWQRQVREVYDRGHGAACLLHDPEADTVLLVRQFRSPMYVSGQNAFVIEVPAGLLNGAEPAVRMRAELIEETGYEVGALEHVTNLVMSPGAVTEYLACFVGTYRQGEAVGEGGGHAEEGEDIDVLHVPLADAMAMMATGEICDAKTCFLLHHLHARLERRLPPA